MDRKKIFLHTIIVAIIGLGFYFGSGLLRQLQTPPDIQTFLIDYSENFEPVRLQEIRNHTLRWERSGPYGQARPFLIQIGEDIIYHEKNEGLHLLDDPIIENSLRRINVNSGEIVWQQELDEIVREVTNNAEYVYVAFLTRGRPQFDSAYNLVKPGAIKVTAYDIDSGTAVWTGIYSGFSYTSYMDANEEIIGIHGHNGHSSFPDDIFIDARTGDLTEEKLAGFGSDKNVPSELSEKGIRSLHWEELPSGNVIVATGGRVFAYNLASKSNVWETKVGLIVSDFAISQGTIFFLTENATLWAVDEISGHVIGEVQLRDVAFSADGPMANRGISEYLVSADDGSVVIFSRDTQYLFVFRFFPQK